MVAGRPLKTRRESYLKTLRAGLRVVPVMAQTLGPGGQRHGRASGSHRRHLRAKARGRGRRHNRFAVPVPGVVDRCPAAPNAHKPPQNGGLVSSVDHVFDRDVDSRIRGWNFLPASRWITPPLGPPQGVGGPPGTCGTSPNLMNKQGGDRLYTWTAGPGRRPAPHTLTHRRPAPRPRRRHRRAVQNTRKRRAILAVWLILAALAGAAVACLAT